MPCINWWEMSTQIPSVRITISFLGISRLQDDYSLEQASTDKTSIVGCPKSFPKYLFLIRGEQFPEFMWLTCTLISKEFPQVLFLEDKHSSAASTVPVIRQVYGQSYFGLPHFPSVKVSEENGETSALLTTSAVHQRALPFSIPQIGSLISIDTSSYCKL